jgi:phage baseplate assembly protein W
MMALSDYNGATVSGTVAQKRLYADFDMMMSIHPIKKTLSPLKDIDAVKASVKHLVLTNFYERPFQPQLGSNLRALLFEQADAFTAIALKKAIIDVLIEYEPRVDNITCQISDDPDNNSYVVTVGFTVISLSSNTEVTLSVQRLR